MIWTRKTIMKKRKNMMMKTMKRRNDHAEQEVQLLSLF
jgi:hypothetical protein